MHLLGTEHNLKMSLFIYFWLSWLFLAAHRLALVAGSSGFFSCRAPPFEHSGFSSCSRRAQQLLNSDTQTPRLQQLWPWALLLLGRWDLPRPGIQLMSSALAYVFLTSGPQGKSKMNFLRPYFLMTCLEFDLKYLKKEKGRRKGKYAESQSLLTG